MHFNYSKSGMDILKYKNLLDENDAFDNIILDLAEKGELKIGVVRLNRARWRVFRLIRNYFVSLKEKSFFNHN